MKFGIMQQDNLQVGARVLATGTKKVKDDEPGVITLIIDEDYVEVKFDSLKKACKIKRSRLTPSKQSPGHSARESDPDASSVPSQAYGSFIFKVGTVVIANGSKKVEENSVGKIVEDTKGQCKDDHHVMVKFH